MNPAPATTLIQAHIDPAIRDKATEVLDGMGLTVSDAVGILLTRVANDGALPAGLAAPPPQARPARSGMATRVTALAERLATAYDTRPVTKEEWDAASSDAPAEPGT